MSKGPHLDKCIVDFGALPCLWKLLSKSIEEREVWRIIKGLTKVNNRRIKAAQIESAKSQFPEYEEDIVPKLDYLEGRHATTVELLAEQEQSRKKTETASQKAEKKNVHESEDESEQEDADEEPEKETTNDVPAEQMSDQGGSDEENESEDKLSPSDDELCAAIDEILREVDIHTVKYHASWSGCVPASKEMLRKAHVAI